jgi:phosphate transport system protein
VSVHLQKEIGRLKKSLLSLSALVEDTVHGAIRSLRDCDAEMARGIIETDVRIDEREVDIEEECQKILALHQPVAHDLRFIIAVLKINAELEHIGDATVNIAERLLFMVTQESIAMPFDYIRMAQKALEMLNKSIDALINLDLGLAHAVIDADDEVDAMNRQAYQQIEESIRRTPALVGIYTHLLGISRHIERIGDHASNIAEDVIYLVEGTIVRHRTEEYRSRRES